MRKLMLQDLADCPVPAELELSPIALRRLIAKITYDLLNAKLSGARAKLEPDEQNRLTNYAGWLESLGLVLPSDDFASENVFYIASSIRELLFSHSSNSSIRDLLQFLGTVLLAGASTHPAVGTILGKRCTDMLQRPQNSDCIGASLATVASLTARDFGKVIGLHRYSESLAKRALDDQANLPDLAETFGFLLIARSSAELAWAMLFGNQELAKNAMETVDRGILGQSNEMGGVSSVRWLARRWLAFVRALWERSSQVILTRAGLSTSYRRRLASDGIVELWPQQSNAINAGILDANNFVVAIPTGSGKTLLAELSIIKSLPDTSKGWVCYVAPTRALVSQVERDLSPRLEAEGIDVRSVLAGPEESDILGQELVELVAPRTVTVVTPEKLESYYRFAPESFNELSLLIVDEAQVIGESSRGPVQEQIITRIRKQKPDAKILLLSAVVSNVDELSTWLGPSAKSYHTSVRLNRQFFAVAVRLDKLVNAQEYSWRGENRRHAYYQGGLVTDFDLEESLRQGKRTVTVSVGIDHGFEIVVREKKQNDNWIQLDEETKTNDHARQIAAKLHLHGETTLVFCAQRRTAVNQAKSLCSDVGASPLGAEQENLAKAIGYYLSDKHPLLHLVERGIAYHHSLLPPIVQRLIEHGVKQKVISTLFTTTTLREGLNLPAQNVIVASEQYFSDELGRNEEMDVSSFVNIAGRAGRPHMDTLGMAILVPSELFRAARLGRKYFLYGPEALAVVSAMARFIQTIEQASETIDFGTLRPSDQALILSLYASGIRQKNPLKELFESTLAYSQASFDSDSVSTFCIKSFEWLKTNLGKDRLEVLAKLGFGLQGSLAIEHFIDEHTKELTSEGSGLDFGDKQSILLTKLCVDGCRAIPELRNRSLRNESGWESRLVHDCTVDWINGESLPSMAEKYRLGSDLEDTVARIVEVTSDIAQWLPWGLGAIHYALSSRGIKLDNILPYLPLYVRFGVPSRLAALLSLVGVFDRETAITLAQRCDSAPTLEDVQKWYSQANLDDLIGSAPSFPLLQRGRSRLKLAAVSILNPSTAIKLGTPLVIDRQNGQFIARTLDAEVAGEIEAQKVMQDRFGKARHLFGIATVRNGEATALIADL
jgi:superfamily II DNA or RNA helicase